MYNVYVHAIVVITIIISACAVHKVGDIIILLSVECRQYIYIYVIVHVYNIVLWYGMYLYIQSCGYKCICA